MKNESDKSSIEILIKEKPDYVEKSVERWFESVPPEERDKPVLGIFGENKPKKILSPKQIYDGIMEEIKLGKLSNYGIFFLETVVKDFGEGEK